MPTVQLRFLAPGEAAALVDGRLPAGLARHPEWPLPESVDAAAMFLELVRADVDPGPWGIALVVSGPRGEVVGDAGFHGPPGPGTPVVVEIGYSVVPSRRGEGIATAATRALLAHAFGHGAEVVRAETRSDNPASQRVLQTAGFTDRGPDRSGHLVFERARPWPGRVTS